MPAGDLLLLKSGVVLLAFLLLASWERLRPAEGGPLLVRLGHASRAGLRRLGRNLGLFGLNALLSPLLVVPLTAWAGGIQLGLRPAALTGAGGLGADLLLLDLWLYVWHRANHELPALWRFHEVHHLDETLDVTSAVRFHAGEVALSALARMPLIIVLGIPLSSVIVFEALVLVATMFHHSDIRLPARAEAALARLLVTPGIHWVHHHARQADTDSNYGTILSLWDRLFGSRSPTRRSPGMRIGVERRHDRPFPALLLSPFRAQPRAKAAPSSARR